MTQPPSAGMPAGGFNIPPPPPHGGPVFTNGPVNPNFGADFNAQAVAEKQMAAMRRVRNIRAGLAMITIFCLSKIAVDSRRLYAEEKSFIETLEQADRDCNNTAPISTIPAFAELAAKAGGGGSSTSPPAAAAAAPQLSAIQQTEFTGMYCYAAQNFPMATVRHVVIRALHEYEGRLARTLENARVQRYEEQQKQQQQQQSKNAGKGAVSSSSSSSSQQQQQMPRATNEDLTNEFNNLPRHVPARLFGASVEHALRRANMTHESLQRGVPCMTNEEAEVKSFEHLVLRGMLRVGQAASFEGFGKTIWERKMDELAKLNSNAEGGSNGGN